MPRAPKLVDCEIVKEILGKNIFLQFHELFHQAISSMALRYVVFLGRHAAIREYHANIWKAPLNYCHVAFNPPRPL